MIWKYKKMTTIVSGFGDNYVEDVSWMSMTETTETWTICETGAKNSTRIRYQSRPVVVY